MLSELRELYDECEVYKNVTDNLPLVVGSVITLVVAGKVVRYALTYNRLRRARNEAKKQLKASKQIWKERALSQITAEESHQIVSLKFGDLQTSLNKGELTAKQVLHAFQRKAAVEDERLNFVAEPLDPHAVEKLAEELDAIPVSERDRLPLFGIPLSVKENEEFVGHCSTTGCSSFLGSLSEESSPRVKILKHFGAMPFIRTNIPQAMLSFSCGNPIYGDTVNAWDTKREPGGSSGGEGSAIACGASVLGLGGDIGGSIRIPSAWSGVAGLKPTAGRVSFCNAKYASSKQQAVKATAGPMASSVDALIVATRVLSSEEMFLEDPSIPRQSFNEQELYSTRPLTIGVFEADGPIDVCNAGRRAVRAAANFLTAKGHKVVPYKLRDLEKCGMDHFPGAIFSDGGSHLAASLYGDSLIPDNRSMFSLISLPPVLKKAFNFIFSFMLPRYMMSALYRNEGVKSVSDYLDFLTEIEEYRRRVIKDWKEQGIDAVVCPAMPVPAIPLGDSGLITGAVGYTILWNLLNFPAGVIPVTNVTADDTAADAANFSSSDMFFRIMKRGLVDSEGLPMGVQFVSLPYCEETCLRLMKEVETAADFTPLVRRS